MELDSTLTAFDTAKTMLFIERNTFIFVALQCDVPALRTMSRSAKF